MSKNKKTKSLRIAFFTNTYLPNNYGSVTSIETFRRGLKELGHEVFVFAPDFKDYEDEKGDKIFRYPSVMWKYKIQYPLPISVSPKINKIFKELDFDIVHSHQPFSIGKDGLRQAKANKIPIVFTYHCRYEDYVHYIPVVPTDILKDFVKKQATIFANKCNQVIAPSGTIKKLITRRGIKKPITVLPTGIDLKKFSSGKRDETRKKFNIKNNELLLLSVGRIEQEKNVNLLFNSALEMLKKYSHLKLMIVGKGSEKINLAKQAKQEELKDRVIFTGLISKNKIQDYYSSGDIFLQSSTSETQGLVVNEAMAANVPVVAVEATGAKDIIKHNKTGFLTKNNQKDFLKFLEKLIKDDKKRLKLAENGREDALNYDYLKNTKELIEVYESLIKETGSKKRSIIPCAIRKK